ncbi:U4/U6 small nuclear ribonucleoprotein Prp31 [Thelohanellus kitauei]|uniref:U4/U6 small nuclear ribonucleoprotein Prp31 n=1 Tax=Thelohanellus kitauei TaxID=669202 RepID=A0A0C2JA53_THEKT|nr:U4/U6 small nuclear ribonucleoprotein Prp31 [Thelohanellus kitauei]
MGAAGGLNALQQMPACNILLLGSQRRSLVGFSSVSVQPHTGFIYHSPIVQKMPPAYRKKAARVVASKVTLTIRVDGNREYTDGSYGEQMYDEICKKYGQWMAPPPVKMVKALPIPGDQPRRKRGGRRQRHEKQKYALTELRKQANRVYLGQIQEDVYQDAIGFGLNSLVQPGSGKVRTAAIDTKTKISISKRLQKNLASMSNTFGTKTMMRSNVSGLASSVAFTPMQGLEIVNPNIAEKDPKVTNESMKYFSQKSGFQSSKHI